MKNLAVILAVLLPYLCLSQRTLTGKVVDRTNDKPLAHANISLTHLRTGTTTGNDGRFIISIPENVNEINVSYAGYISRAIKLDTIPADYSISLFPSTTGEEVVVIGSRNLARTKTQTPVPVDIIQVSTLAKQTGQMDLNQLLSFAAPSFQSTRQAVSDGTDHVDPAQLRGLGNDQVLILVNGKRRHQSALVNVNGTVNRGQVGTDLNSIPISAIDRIEVLRDGAAAQYGSDAIAGVINIVLKKNINQFTASVSYGENITSYQKSYALDKINNSSLSNVNVHDGGNFQAGVNYGVGLKGRGYLNISGEYSLREATNRGGTYTGPVYANVNGVNRDDSILNAKGLDRNAFDMRIGNSRIVSGGLMINGAYQLNSIWTVKLFGGFNKKNGEAAGFFRYPSSISSSAGIYATPALDLYPNGFLPLIKSNIKDYSGSISLEGRIGKWNASLSNTFGKNNFDFTVDHSVNYTQFAETDDPQTKFQAGGLEFIQNTVNADLTRNFNVLQGLNIAYGAEFRIDHYAQKAGEESSYLNYNTNSGAASGAQVFAGFVPAYAQGHSRHNVAAYIDLEQDFTRNWMVEFALRGEDYSDFGSTLNYKLASRYKLMDQFSIRAAASSGFRAPSMQQQFYAKTNTIFVSTPNGLVPTESGTFTNDSKPAEILGIPKLKEETSRNYSVGFTLTPMKGLEITVDGYLINIKNRIVLTNNFSGGNDPVLTQLLKDNGATTANFFTNAIDTKSKGLETVINYHTAIGKQSRLGISMAASFMKHEVKKGADGKPLIKASDILVNSGQLGNYFNREDQSRIEVANPRTKGNIMVTFEHGKWNAMMRLVYFGKVVYLDPTIKPNDPASFPVNVFTGQKETLDQEFGGKSVTDLSLGYELHRGIRITIGATNLFDVYQDAHTHSGNISLGRFIYSRRVQQMGVNGRFLFARVAFDLATQKK